MDEIQPALRLWTGSLDTSARQTLSEGNTLQPLAPGGGIAPTA